MTARALFASVAVAVVLAACSSTGDDAPTSTGRPHDQPAATATVAASEASPRLPEPTDFRVDVIVTGKQCFDAASCVYTYTVDPWPTSSYPAQPDGTKLVVIYTVTGGDQDQIGNFTDDGVTLHRETNAKIIGPDGATLTATVTRVIVED